MTMRITEVHRGYELEAEAEALANSVTVKVFALDEEGNRPPDAEPMNVQTFEATAQSPTGAAALLQSALVHARSSIDDLLGPDTAAEEPPGAQQLGPGVMLRR